MTVRPLRALEAPAAVAVIHAAFAGMAVDPPSGAMAETSASLAAHLATQGGFAWAGDDGALCGVLLWTMRGDALHLHRLAVLPAWRRRGVATGLLMAAEAEARGQGAARLLLGVRVSLVSNHRLFTAAGFREIGRTAHAGYDRPTSIELEKRLA